VLGVICFHDRGSANGRGCDATQSMIAVVADCHRVNVSRSIGRLIDYGYIVATKGGKNGSRYSYRVIYNSAECSGIAIKNGAECSGIAIKNGPECSNVVGNIVSAQEVSAYKERKEASNEPAQGNSVETACTARQRNSVETASKPYGRSTRPEALPTGNPDDDVGMVLLSVWEDGEFTARLDREALNGRRFRSDIADALYERLDGIHCGYELGDPIAGRAYRLLNTDICREAA
jgi:hypothetical protein